MPTFRDLTQRQFLPMETKTKTVGTGGLTTFPLPEVGLGAKLYLNFAGSLDVTLAGGTVTLSPLGIRNAISILRVRLNDGSLLYEMEGFNTKVPSVLTHGYDPEITQISRAYTGTVPYNAPAASAVLTSQSYPVNFTVEVPFINNDKDMLGLVLLQNGTTQATVEIVWNPVAGDGISSVVSTTGAPTTVMNLTVTPVLELYTLPSVDQKTLIDLLRPYLRFMNQWKSEYESITSSATLKKKLERGSIYTKIAHRFLVNGALNSLSPSNFRILLKGNDAPLSIPRDIQLYLQRRNYGFDLPEGLFVHDFDRSFGIQQFGDMRDYLDSRQVTELVSEVQYNSGSYAANSFVYTITNKLTPVNI